VFWVRIRNDGAGIPPDRIVGIFEFYVRGEADARASGPGVGLALTKMLTELHGGTLEALSTAAVKAQSSASDCAWCCGMTQCQCAGSVRGLLALLFVAVLANLVTNHTADGCTADSTQHTATTYRVTSRRTHSRADGCSFLRIAPSTASGKGQRCDNGKCGVSR
jgi:hypothetical protein